MSHEPTQPISGGRTLPRIGIVVAGGADDLGKSLFARIVRLEIQRRLPGALIRCFGLEPYAQPQGLDGGEPLEPLGAWNPERREELAEEFDCVIVGGGDLVPGPVTGGPERELEERCPVMWLGVGLTGEHTPEESARLRSAFDRSPYVSVKDEASRRRLQAAGIDREVELLPGPALLATRHFDREVLDKRLAYLRLMGWYPAKGRALVVRGDGNAAHLGAVLAGPIGRILKGRGDLSVVIAEIASQAEGGEFARALSESLTVDVYRMPSEVAVEDWVAALSVAHGFIGSSPAGAMVAAAFGEPVVVLNLDGRFDPAGLELPGAALVGEGKEVADAFEQASLWAAEGVADQALLSPLRERLDRHLDRVAENAGQAVRRQGGEQEERTDFEAEAALLRTAHDVLTRRLAAERSLFADRAASWPEVARLEAKISWLDGELRSLKSRRLYRYSAPLLSVYATLRRWLGLKK